MAADTLRHHHPINFLIELLEFYLCKITYPRLCMLFLVSCAKFASSLNSRLVCVCQCKASLIWGLLAANLIDMAVKHTKFQHFVKCCGVPPSWHGVPCFFWVLQIETWKEIMLFQRPIKSNVDVGRYIDMKYWLKYWRLIWVYCTTINVAKL